MEKNKMTLDRAKELYEQAAHAYASLLEEQVREQDKEGTMTSDNFKICYYPVKDEFRTLYLHPEEEYVAEGDYTGKLTFDDVRYALEEKVDFKLLLEVSSFGHGLRSYVEARSKEELSTPTLATLEKVDLKNSLEGAIRTICSVGADELVRNKGLLHRFFREVEFAKGHEITLRWMEEKDQEQMHIAKKKKRNQRSNE